MYIIFGCGRYGREAYQHLGDDKVSCFCDNDCTLIGTMLFGKKIIRVSRAAELANENNLIVVCGNEDNTDAMVMQLETLGVQFFLVYTYMAKQQASFDIFITGECSYKDVLSHQNNYYRDRSNRLFYKYINKTKELEALKRYSDITELKCESGYARKRQMELLEFAKNVFAELETLKIRPFLVFGNLLGQYRHGGFVPWDDDLDFGLMRKDYYALIEYFKKEYHVVVYDGKQSEYTHEVHLSRMKEIMEQYPDQYVLDVLKDQLQIMKGSNLMNRLCIDIWAYDYYEDDYDIEDHRKYLRELQKQFKEINYVDKIIEIQKNEIKNNPHISTEPTGHIFMGIDNVGSYLRLELFQHWISKDDILPIKEVHYEGQKFYGPKKPESLLELLYGDYMAYPQRLLPDHDYCDSFNRQTYPSVEFYLIDAFEIFHFLPLYYEFQKAGIYCRFIAEKNEWNTSGKWFDYDEAIKVLNNNNAKYDICCDPDVDVAFTTQDASILRKYRNKKAHLSYGHSFMLNGYMLSNRTSDGFDYKLVHGNFSKEIFIDKKAECKMFIVGYPKYQMDCDIVYDDFSPIKKMIERENKDNKPILLYFPTWNDNSSVEKYSESIKRLKDEFFIVSKAHHCMGRLKSERERLKCLESISDVVAAGNQSIYELALCGDIAICDACSGASTEVPYANPRLKIVLLDNNINEKYDDRVNYFAGKVSDPALLYDIVSNTFKSDKYIGERISVLKYIYADSNEIQIKDLVNEILNIKKNL